MQCLERDIFCEYDRCNSTSAQAEQSVKMFKGAAHQVLMRLKLSRVGMESSELAACASAL